MDSNYYFTHREKGEETVSQGKAFTEDAGYMDRHKAWMVRDDHLFLNPEPMTIYTSKPMTEKTIKHYHDCFPDVELTINFGMDQEELQLYTEGD